MKFTPEATLAQKEGWKEQMLKLKDLVPQIKELISGQKLPHAKDGGWHDGMDCFPMYHCGFPTVIVFRCHPKIR